MLVMILEKVPTSLRGALSRWLLEPKTGIFLGNPSARVRDELWNRAVNKAKNSGNVLQIWTDGNPQGFSYRQYGESGTKIHHLYLQSSALLGTNLTLHPNS